MAAAAAIAALLAGPAVAGGATKNAIGIKGVSVLSLANDYQDDVMPRATIMTSEQKDLITGVSLECGLFTRTKVKGQKGSADSSTAHSKVEIAVIIDAGTAAERMAAPGWVTFCERQQTLSSVLGGVLESCTVALSDDDGDGVPDSGSFTKNDCEFSDEEIELILKTMGAHHFNFILTDLGATGAAGHTIDVRARVTVNGSGDYDANATVGKGVLTVEEVRLAKDFQL